MLSLRCFRLCLIAYAILTAGLAQAATPNFLIFMADDMTYTDLGCYGNKDVRTPHLDAFAEQGIKFTKCFNPAPMCSPLRQSLYTGIYPVRNGAHPNHSQVHHGIKSLPHHLNALGYRTAILGKRHEAPDSAFPFESLGGRHHDNGKGLDLDLSKAEQFFSDAASTEKPFCLVVCSNQPHTPWNRGDATAYDTSSFTIPPYMVDTKETRDGLADYYAEITYMDAQFGRCIDALNKGGLSKNTVVIFLSEQGSNFPFCKWTCYGTGIRSAMLLGWPGSKVKSPVTDRLTSYVDIVPTLVELAGGHPEELDFDGNSFARWLTGKKQPAAKHAFAVQTSRGIFHGPEAYGIRSATDGRYLLIKNLNYESKFMNGVTKRSDIYQSWKISPNRYRQYQERPEFELFNLDEDPWNLSNLAESQSHTQIKERLHQAMTDWMQSQGDQGTKTELNATTRQIKRTKP